LIFGNQYSIICDLANNEFIRLPVQLTKDLFLNNHTYNSLIESELYDTIYLYDLFEKLIGKNYLNFYDDTLLSDFDINLLEPYSIVNCIIEFNIELIKYYPKVIRQLNKLQCRDIQLRFYSQVKLSQLISFLKLFNSSSIMNIDIILPYSHNVIDDISNHLTIINRVTRVIVFASDRNDVVQVKQISVMFVIQEIKNNKHCGFIHPNYFNSSFRNYTENINYNSCLNRKISIDYHGMIKNCPSLSNSFGNIKTTQLDDVLKNCHFTALWFINKDKIRICKDCEFRYICTDCRAYLSEPLDILSKPLKCGYDPYRGIWKDWKSLVECLDAINYYEL